jgi:integrase/recombinase XerC
MPKIKEIEDFANYQKHLNKSESTITSYKNDIIVFAKWFDNVNHYHFTIYKITPTDIRLYKQYLMDNEFKPNTINRKMLSLKYFMRWGWDTKKMEYRFPFPKPVKENSITAKWLDRLEQNSLLRHFERHAKVRNIAIVKVLLHTGLRIKELCNLKWKHVTITNRKGNIIVNYGKGNKSRDIPLNKSARLAFESINYKANVGRDNKVFIGQRGTLTPRGVQLMLKRVLANTDLADISPHDLRHSFCKNLVDSGVSLEKIAMLAGHESLDTTKIYCYPSHADLTEAVDRISEEE